MAAKRRLSRAPDPLKKKAKAKAETPAPSDESLYEFLKSTLSLAQELFDGTRPIKTQFMKLPAKKLYADYYEKIAAPISLTEIKHKVDQHAYAGAQEFLADFRLMSDNASTYNMKESVIAKDAENIYNFVSDQVNQFAGKDIVSDRHGEEEKDAETEATAEPEKKEKEATKLKLKLPKSTKKSNKQDSKEQQTQQDSAKVEGENLLAKPVTSEVKPKLLDLLASLTEHTHKKERIADVFLDEPPKKLYPDYYEVIQHPIAINTIQRNVNNRKTQKYATIGEFVNDVNLIWKNAETYNEEGSVIVNYAKVLSQVFNDNLQKLAESEGAYVGDIVTGGQDQQKPKQEDETEDQASKRRKKQSQKVPAAVSPIPSSLKLKTGSPRPSEEPVVKKRGRPSKKQVVAEPLSAGRPKRGRSVSVHDHVESTEEGQLEYEAGVEAGETTTATKSPSEGAIGVDNTEVSVGGDTTGAADDVADSVKEAAEEEGGILLRDIDIKLVLDTKPKRKVKDGKDALIKYVSIFSSRPKFVSNTQRLQYAQNNPDAQFSQTVFQNWFEYDFETSDYKLSNYSLNLPVYNNVSSKGSVTILATLSGDLAEKKYDNLLTVNDELVKPSPSITYADSENVITSRYDLKLALGLNNIRIAVKVLKSNAADFNSGIDSTNILAGETNEPLPEETVNFWVNVCH